MSEMQNDSYDRYTPRALRMHPKSLPPLSHSVPKQIPHLPASHVLPPPLLGFIDLTVVKLPFSLLCRRPLQPACETRLVDKQTVSR